MGVERNIVDTRPRDNLGEATEEDNGVEIRTGKRGGGRVPGYMKPTVVSSRKAWYVTDRMQKISMQENSLPTVGRAVTAHRQDSALSYQTMLSQDGYLSVEKKREPAAYHYLNSNEAQRTTDQTGMNDLDNALYGHGYGSRTFDRERTDDDNKNKHFSSKFGHTDGREIPVRIPGIGYDRSTFGAFRQSRPVLSNRQIYSTFQQQPRTDSDFDHIQTSQSISVSTNNIHARKAGENQTYPQQRKWNNQNNLPKSLANNLHKRISQHDSEYSLKGKDGDQELKENGCIIEETILLTDRTVRPLSVNSRTTADTTVRLLTSRQNQRIGLDLQQDAMMSKHQWPQEAVMSSSSRLYSTTPGLSVMASPVHLRGAWQETSKERELGKIIHVNDDEFKKLPVHERLLLRGKSAERTKDLQYFLRTPNGIIRFRDYDTQPTIEQKRLNLSYGAQKGYNLRRSNTELSPINRNARLKAPYRAGRLKSEKSKRENQNGYHKHFTSGVSKHPVSGSNCSTHSAATNPTLTGENGIIQQQNDAEHRPNPNVKLNQEKSPEGNTAANRSLTQDNPIKMITNLQNNQNNIIPPRTQVVSGYNFWTRNGNSGIVNNNKEVTSDSEVEERVYPEDDDVKTEWILKWLENMNDVELERPASPLIADDEPPQTDTAIHIVYSEN